MLPKQTKRRFYRSFGHSWCDCKCRINTIVGYFEFLNKNQTAADPVISYRSPDIFTFIVSGKISAISKSENHTYFRNCFPDFSVDSIKNSILDTGYQPLSSDDFRTICRKRCDFRCARLAYLILFFAFLRY